MGFMYFTYAEDRLLHTMFPATGIVKKYDSGFCLRAGA